MSKVIIATLKQDLTRAYALFEKVLDFSVLAGICLSIVCAYSRVVGGSFIYLFKRRSISGCIFKSGYSDCEKVHHKARLSLA